MGLKTEKLTEQEFVYRACPSTIKAKSLTLDRIYGKTLAWNQLCSTVHNSGVLSGGWYSLPIAFSFVNTHKYLFSCVGSGFSQYRLRDTVAGIVGTAWGKDTKQIYIASQSTNESTTIQITGEGGDFDSYTNCIDLTLLYGSEIDGMTDAEILAKFESEFPGYHSYEPGKLISNDAESIETVGFNQWDEEWEVGDIDASSGALISATDRIRTKNPIPVIGGTSYCMSYSGGITNNTTIITWLVLYDINNDFVDKIGIGITGTNRANTFTVPANVRYIRFYCLPAYGTTYNHDICINLSNASKNGTYEPYRKSTMQLNLGSFQVRDSQGNVTTITGGLKSAGSARDEIVGNKYIKRVGSAFVKDLQWYVSDIFFQTAIIGIKTRSDSTIPLGNNMLSDVYIPTRATLWTNTGDREFGCSVATTFRVRDSRYSTVNEFLTSNQNTVFYYELATPIEYELVEPLVPTMKAGETEARISPNADGLSAPFCADMTYSVADYTEYTDRAGTLVKGASVDLTDITASGELSGNAFKAIAEHIAKLTLRVETLEAGVGTVDTLSSTSVDSANGYYINGDKTVIIGSGAPTMVPAFAGQFYINTSGPALYYAVNNSATTD